MYIYIKNIDNDKKNDNIIKPLVNFVDDITIDWFVLIFEKLNIIKLSIVKKKIIINEFCNNDLFKKNKK